MADLMPPPSDLVPDELTALRAELDRLDDTLHDMLMRRAAVVEQVAALRGKVAFRPGREAAILRRLIGRHHGALPARAIVRIWRELLAGTTEMQGRQALAICDPQGGGEVAALAREHFGALTPLHVHRSPAQALRAVTAGDATAAILPVPGEGSDEAGEGAPAGWWAALLSREMPRVHVVGRLPFWRPRPAGAPRAEALVAATAAPDPSGDDRSLIGFETAAGLSRARLSAALADAGLAPRAILLRRRGGAPAQAPSAQALIEVSGFVDETDPRLAALRPMLQTPPVVLGAYAVPLEGTQE